MKRLPILLSCFVAVIGVSSAQIPTNGLIAYFPFNGNANDESPSVVQTTITDCSLIQDRFGNANRAYYFNGSTSQITATVDSKFSVSNVTLSAWVKAENYTMNNPRVVAVGNPDYVDHFYSMVWHDIDSTISPGTIDFYSAALGENYSTAAFPSDNTWHHLAVTLDGTVLSFYLDGIPAGTLSQARL